MKPNLADAYAQRGLIRLLQGRDDEAQQDFDRRLGLNKNLRQSLESHEWLHRLWSKWFRLPAEQFDAINFAGIALYKIGIILFNLTPYIALRITG